MINANELRIGNMLIVGGIERLVFVSAIFKTHFRCQDMDGISFEESIRCNYIPIPLSEEILLKVGFVKGISNYDEERTIFSIQVSNNTSLYFDAHKDWMRDNLCVEWYLSQEWNNNHFKNDIGWVKIKNIHQLQNLYFAFSGEELNTSGLINNNNR